MGRWFRLSVVRSLSPFRVHLFITESPIFVAAFHVGIRVVPEGAIPSLDIWEGAHSSRVLYAVADAAAVEISASQAGVLELGTVGLGG